MSLAERKVLDSQVVGPTAQITIQSPERTDRAEPEAKPKGPLSALAKVKRSQHSGHTGRVGDWEERVTTRALASPSVKIRGLLVSVCSEDLWHPGLQTIF